MVWGLVAVVGVFNVKRPSLLDDLLVGVSTLGTGTSEVRLVCGGNDGNHLDVHEGGDGQGVRSCAHCCVLLSLIEV